MRVGTLRCQVVFQEKTQIKSGAGQVKDSWSDVLSAWVSIQPISGKEQFLSNQKFQSTTHKIRARYSNLINNKQRILFGNRVFEIIAPPMNIFERNKELEILVEEKV